jgi:hypothetical protein
MPNITLPHTEKLINIDSSVLLRAMSSARWNRDPENLRIIKDINGANEEMDQLKDVGLTVKFEKVKVLTTSEMISEWFGATGEFYVITTVIDGSGSPFEYKTQYFQGIKRDDFLPLGDGGMLVSFLKNPKWFLDIHMLVMESDSDIRKLGEIIGQAKEEAKLDDVIGFVGTAAAFDPTMISKVVTGVNLFLTILSGVLKANGDDHIATIHDFYLKHQAFGKGRHPEQGLKKFQDVEVAYNIELTEL